MVIENRIEEKNSWWKFKKMGARECGITALVLIFLGIVEFFGRGNGSLVGVGLLFLIIAIYKKQKIKAKK